ncbi:MAG: hypothetical protein RMM58_06965 [Chloroflexota bacterium]|nr:hypothetical protein [Dehalococcoidia bacterium]MDW8253603.1 hypothetical protein [Chloroflexota bacterium]
MAKPYQHAIVSALLAAGTYAITRRPLAAAAALAAGTLIDADHLVDYAVCKVTRTRDWLILPLHGWEFGALGVVAALRYPLVLPAMVSYLVHLTMDHLFNGLGRPFAYSILWRAGHQFHVPRLQVKVTPHSWVEDPPWKWFH